MKDKKRKYWATDLDGVPRSLFTLKWSKDNFYYIDRLGSREFKISYHSPRDGRAQTHLKIDGFCYDPPSFSVPTYNIKGLRGLGGGSCRIDALNSYPKIKGRDQKTLYPLGIPSAAYYRHYLSNLQWRVFFLEKDNIGALENDLGIKRSLESDHAEAIGLFIDNGTNPWIVVEFSRIRVEHPDWLKDLPPNAVEATIRAMLKKRSPANPLKSLR